MFAALVCTDRLHVLFTRLFRIVQNAGESNKVRSGSWLRMEWRPPIGKIFPIGKKKFQELSLNKISNVRHIKYLLHTVSPSIQIYEVSHPTTQSALTETLNFR